ncbi:MAG: isoaspartyl peptidase/L-asparaginase, partial [Vicinamibacteria bacterium]
TDEGGFGGIGGVSGVRHPVTLARLVMEETDHLLLTGHGAARVAKWFGVERDGPIEEERRAAWEKLLREITDESGRVPDWKRLPDLLRRRGILREVSDAGTVGAVARDAHGKTAVATSTGGIWLKLPGRIGDSSILGAGTFASRAGGVSATGQGESIIRLELARRAVDEMGRCGVQEAIDRAMEEATRAECLCGMAGIDARGDIGEAHNTETMVTERRTGEV